MKLKTERPYLYYLTLQGKKGSSWIADERVKKQFLNHLLRMQEETKFTVYAFCILDKEAYFLLELPDSTKITRTIGKISKELERSYLEQFPAGSEKVAHTCKNLNQCCGKTLLEYCCKIHMYSCDFARRFEDYWWSSYVEYLNKSVTGLVKTSTLLECLDSDPRRALQKFVIYHRNYVTVHYLNSDDSEIRENHL